ncbi:MAG: hypothetical protein ACFE0I_06240 [Elainellaceae cyanobacterium]
MSPALKFQTFDHQPIRGEFSPYSQPHQIALAQPSRLHPSSKRRRSSGSRRVHSTIASSPRREQRSNIQTLPSSRAPQWLTLLVAAQRSSMSIMILMVAAVLGVYGWTVFSQQLWSHQYQKLQTLQRNERDLTTANEMLKSESARQAEGSESGLRLPGPDTNMFVRPAPTRPQNPIADPDPSLSPITVDRPVGY